MKTVMQLRFLLPVALAAAGLPPLAAQNELVVERGAVERQGRHWVERITCRAPVREGAKLVVRADLGSVVVKPGANDRVECQVFLKAYAPGKEAAQRSFANFRLGLFRREDGGVYLRGRFGYTRASALRARPARRARAARPARVARPAEPSAPAPPEPPAPPAPPAAPEPPEPPAPPALPAPPATPARLRVHFEIHVPLRFDLDLETRGGDLTVEKLEGALRGATAGGAIRTGDISGAVRLATAGGSIVLGNIGAAVKASTAGGTIRVGNVGGDAKLTTSGGSIITGRIAGTLRGTTAGGDVVVTGADADVVAETAGGQILIGQTGGGVRAETAGGSISLQATHGPIRVETAGGSILLYDVNDAIRAVTQAGSILAQLTVDINRFKASVLETSFGDVEVYLPPNLPLTIDARITSAHGHQILTDFPLQIEPVGSSYRRKVLRGQGNVNGGGPVLRIRTQAGNIKIVKLTPRVLQKIEKRQQRQWKRWLKYHRKPRSRNKEEEQ